MKNPTLKQLEVYILVLVKGKTHAEAAKKLGICRSAVTRRIQRFFSHLK